MLPTILDMVPSPSTWWNPRPSTLDKKTHTLDFMSRNAKAWKFNLLYHNKKNPVELKHCETSSSCRVFYLMKLKPEKEMYYFFWNMITSHENFSALRIFPRRKALDNIDLNQMSHRYVSGVLQNEPSTSAHLIDRIENVNLS